MSLIAKINTYTAISQWLAERDNSKIDKIIYSVNQQLNKFSLSSKQSKHRGLIKAASVYATLKHLGYINNSSEWLTKTYAYKYISKPEFHGLFSGIKYKPVKTLRDEAISCLKNAALDISYRIYREHQFITPFIKAWKSNEEVNPDERWKSQWFSTISEVEEIVGNIARCWQSVSTDDKDYLHAPIPNPTFHLSNQIGGAQGDLVFRNTLVNVIVDENLTKQEFQTAIAYLLLDTNDEYQLQLLSWLFPLRQTAITLKICDLFGNIQQTRNQFKEMIDRNYPIDDFNKDGDGIDPFQYIDRYC